MNLGKLAQEDDTGLRGLHAGRDHGAARPQLASNLEGKHVVVLGRSLIVGKPAALLALQKKAGANATVTVCHSRTADLPSITRQADVLIAAIGRAEFVTADMVKPGAVVDRRRHQPGRRPLPKDRLPPRRRRPFPVRVAP